MDSVRAETAAGVKVQAHILPLEAIDGREPLRERQVRGILAAALWAHQRAVSRKLLRPRNHR